MRVCRPGSRRTLRWYCPSSEAAEDRPRFGDVLRHPVTGSSYRVLAVGTVEPGQMMKVWLEGLGLLVDPDAKDGRLIFYALARGGAHAHRDG